MKNIAKLEIYFLIALNSRHSSPHKTEVLALAMKVFLSYPELLCEQGS